MPPENGNPGDEGTSRMVRVAFRTTGCKVNQFDSGVVAGALADLPVTICGPDDSPDIVVVNACTVTMNADRDGRAAAYRASRTGARVVMAGCLATRLEDQGAVDSLPADIRVVGGTSDRTRLVETLRTMIYGASASNVGLRSNEPPLSLEESAAQPADDARNDDEEDSGPWARSRPLIKIQDGCDCRCSYCIVPLVRGPSRSFGIDGITAQVLAAAESGAAEVVLTGVDLAAWGRTDDGRYGHLADLLVHLTQLRTGMRFRLSSLEPYGLDDDLLEAMANNPDVCPHLHIPMQSGSDAVLSRMNRPYSSQRFASLVLRAAAAVPGLMLGMDVIAGFPGESDSEFLETRDMVARLPITYLHVFPYSPRPGTPAAVAPDQVPDRIRRERGKELRDIAAARRISHAESLVGRNIEAVDIRQSSQGVMALSADYTRVIVTNRFDMATGRRMIRITGAQGAIVTGTDLNHEGQ